MQFTQRDIAVVMSMSLAIITMSVVLPGMGLAGDETVDVGDIPELDVNTNTFDFAGQLPESPGTPAQGTISYDHETGTSGDVKRVLESDNGNATLALATIGTPPKPGVVFTAWDGSGNQIGNEEFNTTTEGTIHTFESNNGEWDIRVEFTSITEVNTDVWDYTVRYNIQDRPESSGGWLSSIPLIGGLFSAGAELASTLAWLGAVVWWGIATIFTVALNLLTALATTTVFIFETMLWLISSYSAVISGAEGLIAVFMTIPALLLSFELAKMMFLAISLLPTT